MPFGERLKKCREDKSLTQEQVAAYFGDDFSRQSISKWEREECYPEVDKLLILSTKMDISLDELFLDELTYLKKGQQSIDFAEKYPGAVAGLKLFAEYLKKM